QYHPRYNVSLKDDKTFPYLKIDLNEPWPRIYVTRRFVEDGARYFGPFSSAGSVRQTLRVLHSIFPLRTCSRDVGKVSRPCLEYHLGRCLAPCSGNVSREEYNRLVQEVILFLEGRRDKVIRELKKQMEESAARMDFERAARLRDQIQAISEVIEGEKIATVIRGDEDVIAFVQEGDQAYVQVIFVRQSRITGREGFLLQGTRQETPREVMTSFVKQYYSSCPHIPPLLLLQHPVEDRALITEWLKSRRGGRVEIKVPRRGARKELVDIAAENARQGLEQLKIKELAVTTSDGVLEELQKVLALPKLPRRIEAYDISNIQGSSAVGSLIVFENGAPRPDHYRRFQIKTVSGANDYAMLKEVLHRRFSRMGKDEGRESWKIVPDLILIDGGKGQLNAALEVLNGLSLQIPVLGLAKENEEVFLPGHERPLLLDRSSAALKLLQRVRDEAHRFAVGYFSRLHRRRLFTSVLDGIPGIGPKRKSALLRHFGTIDRIRQASVEELIAATGMSQQQASKIKEYL
ncbi:MAG: excinuclease ABC subunit UvrC, partial [Dehalococcoidales bacterium]|nr:excinuclease ABC subunit UvrC [Dehalococcoidales bacterium]